MKNDIILRAIGNIDEDFINRAAPADGICPIEKPVHLTYAPWLKRAAPAAACLLVLIAIAVPTLLRLPQAESGGYPSGANNAGASDSMTGSETGGAGISAPSLSLDGGLDYMACYAALEDWRGLPTENYLLNMQDGNTATDRVVFTTLASLAEYADVFVVVPSVRETAQDGDNMQTSIAEYAESIGDILNTSQWDDHTVSTGSRVLIRQLLMSGCTMDEPNNLLRKGGVYLLPLRFNPLWGAYEVVGDLDVLFELNSKGKIVSHSQWEGFNKYDGKSLQTLVDDIRALYTA